MTEFSAIKSLFLVAHCILLNKLPSGKALKRLVLAIYCGDNFWLRNGKCEPCDLHCGYSCDTNSGQCRSCISGFWGDFCHFPCPYNCQHYSYSGYDQYPEVRQCILKIVAGVNLCGAQCNQKTGECYACEDKTFWGPSCDTSCNVNNTGCERCEVTSKCTKCLPNSEKTCRTDSVICPENCISCNSITKTCYSCVQGFWGSNCSNNCLIGNCTNSECNRINGICNSCKSGWWGSNCTEVCETHNCYHCNRVNGRCELCKDGFWGLNCEKPCSTGCVDSRCEIHTGKCRPCKGMVWGDSCNISCFLDNCESMIGCTRDQGPTCFKCKTGMWGERCSKHCSENCTNGCEIDKGQCIQEESTVPETDLEVDKLAADMDVKLVAGISMGCSLAVVIVFILLALLFGRIYWLRRKSQLQKKSGVTITNENASLPVVHTKSAEMGEDIQDDEISRLRRELDEITREEQRLKQRETEELRRKLNEKRKIVAKLRGDKTDGGLEFYEIPTYNKSDSSDVYESLRD